MSPHVSAWGVESLPAVPTIAPTGVRMLEIAIGIDPAPAAAVPAAVRPRWKPGTARLGEPSPQSDPELFTDSDLRAEFRYLARLNGRYGLHELRVAAQNALIRALESRGAKLPTGYVTGKADPAESKVAPRARVLAPAGRPGGQLYWRACSGCNTDLAVYDWTSENVWCNTCLPKHVQPFDVWAAGIAAGSRVYLQPAVAWRGLSHSEYLVTARDGDVLTVQLTGMPESSMTVDIGQCGQHDLTPRRP